MEKSFFEELLKEAQELEIHRYVVGAVIAKNDAVLLLERPKTDFMGGIYELPSGKVEEKETLDAALYREVEEETGLKTREIGKYLGYFDYKSKSDKTTRQFNFAVVVEKPYTVVLPEHVNYAWVERTQLDKYPVSDHVKAVLKSFWGNA